MSSSTLLNSLSLLNQIKAQIKNQSKHSLQEKNQLNQMLEKKSLKSQKIYNKKKVQDNKKYQSSEHQSNQREYCVDNYQTFNVNNDKKTFNFVSTGQFVKNNNKRIEYLLEQTVETLKQLKSYSNHGKKKLIQKINKTCQINQNNLLNLVALKNQLDLETNKYITQNIVQNYY